MQLYAMRATFAIDGAVQLMLFSTWGAWVGWSTSGRADPRTGFAGLRGLGAGQWGGWPHRPAQPIRGPARPLVDQPALPSKTSFLANFRGLKLQVDHSFAKWHR